MVFGCLMAVTIAAGILISAANPSLDTALALATVVVLAAPLVHRASEGRLDPFDPISVFCVIYALMFVIRPLYAAAINETVFQIGHEFVDYGAYLVPMQVAALIGAFGFVVGYEIKLRSLQSVKPILSRLDMLKVQKGGVMLALLGFLGTAL